MMPILNLKTCGLALALLAATTAALTVARPALAQEEEAAPNATLKIGDESPKIWVSGWWKEKAPAPREKGKVYVVDFWASWCPPCREAMPHLIDMADKYGDYADFIAISTDSDPRAAAEFLNSVGDNNIYFALDKNRQSWEDWATAAGRTSIPTTFVVDEKGKIFWVGHTMNVEAPLKKLLIK